MIEGFAAAFLGAAVVTAPSLPQDDGQDAGAVLAIASPSVAIRLHELSGRAEPRLDTGQDHSAGVVVASVRPLLRTDPANPDRAAALGLDRAFVLDPADGESAAGLASQLRALEGWFEVVELDRIGRAHGSGSDAARLPNDPLFPDQYSLRNTGQSVGGEPGVPGADISLLGAWAQIRSASPVTVAVVDSGVSHSHPDLASNLVAGWNFIDNSKDTDDRWNSHGTHCAGIIAAATSNGTGVAGIAPTAGIMPVKVLDQYGFGSESSLAEGLIWAADHGARVASVSLGFDPRPDGQADRVLRAAVVYATESGMLICASAGNSPGIDIGAPARYPETIAVGATDHRDRLWRNTSTGPEMSITAPGVSIWSTWDSIQHHPGEYSYARRSGTSQACPHVAGVAALVLAANERLTPETARAIIERSSDDLGAMGWDAYFGFGRVNAAGAVAEALATSGRDDFGAGDTPCVADFNHDGEVYVDDFLAYLNAFASGNWRADIAAPRGEINSIDLIAFIQAYQRGCPRADLFESAGTYP